MDVLKRTMQILAGGAIATGKEYFSNIEALKTDAAEIQASILGGAKTGMDFFRRMKNQPGGVLKKINNWFYQRGGEYDQYSLGGEDDDFDPGFGGNDSGEEEESPSIDVKSMKNIARGQVGAMYQIGGKQVEASMANTAEIISNLNGRSSEITASINNLNKTLLSLTEKVDKIATILTPTGNKKEERELDLGILDESGGATLGTLGRGISKQIKEHTLVQSAQMIIDSFKNGSFTPEMLAQMGIEMALDSIKVGKSGNTINDVASKVNDTIGAWTQDIVTKISQNSIFQKIFGDMTSSYNPDYGSFVKNTYTKDKAVFDGMTRKTIIDIIPGYLREMTHALTGVRYNIDSRGRMTTKNEDVFMETTKKGTTGFNAISWDANDRIEARMKRNNPNYDKTDFRVIKEVLTSGYIFAIYFSGHNAFTVSEFLPGSQSGLYEKAVELAWNAYHSQFQTRDRTSFESICQDIIAEQFMDVHGSKIESSEFVREVQSRAQQLKSNHIQLATSDRGDVSRRLTMRDARKAMESSLQNRTKSAEEVLDDEEKQEIQREIDARKRQMSGGRFSRDSDYSKYFRDMRKKYTSDQMTDDQIRDKFLEKLTEELMEERKREKLRNESHVSNFDSTDFQGKSIGSVLTEILDIFKNKSINVKVINEPLHVTTAPVPPTIVGANGDVDPLNLGTRGCGPMALSDMFTRSLARNMARAGTYNPYGGTTIGGYMDSARGLGMNLYPEYMNQDMFNSASPYNPVTLFGSGETFRTRPGNLHFMNLIGTSGASAYVSNPMYGGIHKYSIGDLKRDSLLGLRGGAGEGIGNPVGDTLEQVSDSMTRGIGDFSDWLINAGKGYVADPNSLIGAFIRATGINEEDIIEGAEVAKTKTARRIGTIGMLTNAITTRGRSLKDAVSNDVNQFSADFKQRLNDIGANKRNRQQIANLGKEYGEGVLEKVKGRVEAGTISERDQEYAKEALALMQAALADGDGVPDMGAINRVINKIKDRELRSDLFMNIRRLIQSSQKKVENPAKSKLGKILFWGWSIVKKVLSPVFKVIKTGFTFLVGALKKHGKKILKFIAAPFGFAAGLIKSGVKDVFEGLFGTKSKTKQYNLRGKKQSSTDASDMNSKDSEGASGTKSQRSGGLFQTFGRNLRSVGKDIKESDIYNKITGIPAYMKWKAYGLLGESYLGRKITEGVDTAKWLAKTGAKTIGGIPTFVKTMAALSPEERKEMLKHTFGKDGEVSKLFAEGRKRLGSVFEKPIGAIKAFGNKIKAAGDWALRAGKLLSIPAKGIGGFFKNVGSKISDIFKGVGDKLKDTKVGRAASWAKDKIKGVLSKKTSGKSKGIIKKFTESKFAKDFSASFKESLRRGAADGSETSKKLLGFIDGGFGKKESKTLSDDNTSAMLEMMESSVDQDGKPKGRRNILTDIAGGLSTIINMKKKEDEEKKKKEEEEQARKEKEEERGETGTGEEEEKKETSEEQTMNEGTSKIEPTSQGDKENDDEKGKSASEKSDNIGSEYRKNETSKIEPMSNSNSSIDDFKFSGGEKTAESGYGDKSTLVTDGYDSKVVETSNSGNDTKDTSGPSVEASADKQKKDVSTVATKGGGNKITGGAKGIVNSLLSGKGGIKSIIGGLGSKLLSGLGGPLGKIAGGVVKILGGVVTAIGALKGFQMIQKQGQKMFKQIAQPLASTAMKIYQAVRPLMKLIRDVFKIITKVLSKVLNLVMDVVNGLLKVIVPIITKIVQFVSDIITTLTETLIKLIMIPIKKMLDIITPIIKGIGAVVKTILGMVQLIFGAIELGIGRIIQAIGTFMGIFSMGIAGKNLRELGRGMAEQGRSNMTSGLTQVKEGFAEGIQAVVDTAAAILPGGKDGTSADESIKETEGRFATGTGSSVMDGTVVNNTTTNIDQSTVTNTYGNGDTQYNYGSYLGMRDHGCGPIALADAYSRRTGNSMNAKSLTTAMANSGNYSTSRGTSVAGFMNAGNSLGMGMTAGGVTNSSLRNASPSNPITVVGSGGAFGTRSGNTHYMNVVGSDGNGHAYVSNPMKKGITRVSTNDLVNSSVLGIYGSGDIASADDIYTLSEQLGFPDDIADMIDSLKTLAKDFFSMFTGEKSVDAEVKKANQEASLETARSQLGADKYKELETQAYEKFKKDYPQLSTENATSYEGRWKRNKNKYMMDIVANALKEQGDTATTNNKQIMDALENDDAGKVFEDAMKDDSALEEDSTEYESKFGTQKIVDAIKDLSSKLSSGATGGSGGGLSGEWTPIDFTPRTSAPESGNPYYNTTSVGGYSNARVGDPTISGTNVLANCSGYALGRFHEAIGDSKFRFFPNKYGARDGGKFKEVGAAQLRAEPDCGLVIDEAGEVPLPGDIITWKQPGNAGHVAFVEQVPDNDTIVISHSAWGGFSSGDRVFHLDTVKRGNSANMWPLWANKGYIFSALVHNPGMKYQKNMGGSQGPIEFTGSLKGASAWNAYKNKKGVDEFMRTAISAGLTPAQIATITATGIFEDSGQKIFNNAKSLTAVTYDYNGQRAVGIMNSLSNDILSYGGTVGDQLRWIKDAYFQQPYLKGDYATVRHNQFDSADIAAYNQATGRNGFKANWGEYYAPYMEQDLIEGSEHYFRGSLVPECIHTAPGVAKHIGTTIDVYNWMIENGYATGTQISGEDGVSSIYPDTPMTVSEILQYNPTAFTDPGEWTGGVTNVSGNSSVNPGIYGTTTSVVDRSNSSNSYQCMTINDSSSWDDQRFNAFMRDHSDAVVTNYANGTRKIEYNFSTVAGRKEALANAETWSVTKASTSTSNNTKKDVVNNNKSAGFVGPVLPTNTQKSTTTTYTTSTAFYDQWKNSVLNDVSKFYLRTVNKPADSLSFSKGLTANQLYGRLSDAVKAVEWGESHAKEAEARDDHKSPFHPGVYLDMSPYNRYSGKKMFNDYISQYRNIEKTYGSGDVPTVEIPPIDESKFNSTFGSSIDVPTLNDTGLATYFTANPILLEQPTTQNNQYYLVRDNGDAVRDRLDMLLTHTFNVRSESMEEILTEMLEELKKRNESRPGTTPSTNTTTPSLFDNDSIPTGIQRLIHG